VTNEQRHHHKYQLFKLRGKIAQAAPASQDLLLRAAERGSNLGAITVGLKRCDRAAIEALTGAQLGAKRRGGFESDLTDRLTNGRTDIAASRSVKIRLRKERFCTDPFT
jgi:hypothetical protein